MHDAGFAFPDAGARVELQFFCDLMAEAVCARERWCNFLDPAQGPTCLARAGRECSLWQRAVTAGVHPYVPEQGAACISATAQRSCALGRGFAGGALLLGLENGPPACAPLLVGVGGPGTPCALDAECAAGLTCKGVGVACRTCTPQRTLGEACDPVTSPCFTGRCATVDDGGAQCVPYVDIGGACPFDAACNPVTAKGCGPSPGDGGARACVAKDSDGTPCLLPEVCAAGYCNSGHRTDAGARTCGFIAPGRPCGAVGDCGPEAFCSGLGATTPGVCTARIAWGASCTIQRFADVHDGCADGGACFDGTCRGRGQQALGRQCREPATDCVRGAWCPALPLDGGYPTCQPQGFLGEACTASAQCQPGLRCTNNRCELLGSAGMPCFATQQCKDLLFCPLADAGLGFFPCTPLLSPGSDCSASGALCGSGPDNADDGLCVRDGGRGATCQGLQPPGGPCSAHVQCNSGRCLQEDGGFVFPPTVGVCQPSCLP